MLHGRTFVRKGPTRALAHKRMLRRARRRGSRTIAACVAATAVATACTGATSKGRPTAASTGAATTATTAATTTTTPTAPTAPTAPTQLPGTTTSLASTATTIPPGAAPCGTAASPPSAYHHVLWIWMENHSWPQVLGDPSAAPYATGLARQCGTATHYATVGSPSLPNYLGATSGDTWGTQDDSGPDAHPLTVDNLFRQVRTAGGTERSYEEAMPSPCQLTPAGTYAVKHNPAAYYAGGGDRAACRNDDVGLDRLAADLDAGALPTFAFVTPDLCHDTHDCPVSTGDAWLAQWLPRILASPTYRGGDTAVFVVWDEYTPMPNLVVAPSVKPATSSPSPFDHYALLRTTEQLLGLPLLARAKTAASLRSDFAL